MYTRKQMVDLANKYKGATKGSARHKDLVNTFNKVKPNREVANYTCPWCAITVTALAIKAGFTQKNFPMSYNCGTMINRAKALGIWKEADSYKPQIGDVIIYNWADNGRGDCKTGASHTGIVVSVNGNSFDVLEGNKGVTSSVGVRRMRVNGQFIRGFITPKYATATVTKPVTKPAAKYTGAIPTPTLKYGSKGTSVKSLQRFLNWYHPAWKLAVDGMFGSATRNAVKSFQKSEKLDVDGVYGPKTKAKLSAYVVKKNKVISKAEKLAKTAEELSWPYGTAEKKWAYKTGAPTDVCKAAMQKRGYKSKISYSDCGYFQNTVIYKTFGTKVKVLAGVKEPFPAVSGFEIVHKGAVSQSQLKRGDIIRYKKTNGHQHVIMYLGDGKITEAGRGNRFGRITKSTKYASSGVKKETLQVLRVKE